MKTSSRIGLAVALVGALSVCLLIYGLGIFPPRFGLAREKAKRVNCRGNLKQIGLALLIYAGDDVEHGYFPSGDNFAILHEQRYLEDGKVYGCPSSRDFTGSQTARASSYVYCGSGLRDSVSERELTILAYDRIGNHLNTRSAQARWRWLAKVNRGGWVNVLFADGTVKGVSARTEEEFEAACAARGWILPDKQRELAHNRPDNYEDWVNILYCCPPQYPDGTRVEFGIDGKILPREDSSEEPAESGQ